LKSQYKLGTNHILISILISICTLNLYFDWISRYVRNQSLWNKLVSQPMMELQLVNKIK